MHIAIIDYGTGNLRSVEKALQTLGFSAVLTRDKSEIRASGGIILPGVGAFDAAITDLRKNGLENIIEESIGLNKPFLGICLGYQMLFSESEEGKLKGLGLLKGKVKKFNFAGTAFSSLSVPHMGWNRLFIKHESPLFSGIPSGSMVYFAHSFYPEPNDALVVTTVTDYGIEFASGITKGNVFGIQFHPEKSGEVGLSILKNFGGLCSR